MEKPKTLDELLALKQKALEMPDVQENKNTFIVYSKYRYQACEVGLYYIGLVGDAKAASQNYELWIEQREKEDIYRPSASFFALALGIPDTVLTNVSVAHGQGKDKTILTVLENYFNEKEKENGV